MMGRLTSELRQMVELRGVPITLVIQWLASYILFPLWTQALQLSSDNTEPSCELPTGGGEQVFNLRAVLVCPGYHILSLLFWQNLNRKIQQLHILVRSRLELPGRALAFSCRCNSKVIHK